MMIDGCVLLLTSNFCCSYEDVGVASTLRIVQRGMDAKHILFAGRGGEDMRRVVAEKLTKRSLPEPATMV